MEGIEKLDLVLPEFQREYVWTRDQAKQLLVSLLRGYPTGSILIWRTDDPPEIKNNAASRERVGTTSVILDGQQRLTTLYLFTRNEVPPYYRPEDIEEDPRSLYFNLETGDFQYYSKQTMEGDPVWARVVSCFAGAGIDPFRIAETKAGPEGDRFKLAQLYSERLNALRNIGHQDYPVQVVPASATITEAIDVFDRVNSQGTKLSDAELALAHITGTWPEARRRMKAKIDTLAKRRFVFDLTFMVRGLTTVVRRRALYNTIHGATKEELVEGWGCLSGLLDYLTGILPKWAFISSTDDLNTSNVLVPVLAYLAIHDRKFTSEKDVRPCVHWMYAASAWARYTSQTDQRLDHDISIVARGGNPWQQLVDAIIDQRGRIDVKAADLEGRGAQHPLYRMTYVLVKSKGAVDWFNGLPLDGAPGSAYGIHSHHIFPQSLLYGKGAYQSENHLHKQIVNEIANRAFLTGSSNIGLSDKPPALYLAEIDQKYPGALEKQFIPTDRSLWEVDRFEDFLARRRELIANQFNRQMDNLLQQSEPAVEPSVESLVQAGEGPTVEFKSSLRWDVLGKRVNKDLQRQVLKTIAAMLNSEGGVLLIGVADDGSAYGIDADIQTLGRRDVDGFAQTLASLVAEHIGPEFGAYSHSSFPEYQGRTICRVKVDASPKPVFTRDGSGAEFYVRVGNTTRPLDAHAAHEYIGMHWQA